MDTDFELVSVPWQTTRVRFSAWIGRENNGLPLLSTLWRVWNSGRRQRGCQDEARWEHGNTYSTSNTSVGPYIPM